MEKKGGGEILRRAVSGMLPKNRLRDKRLARLKSKSIWKLRVCGTAGQWKWRRRDDLVGAGQAWTGNREMIRRDTAMVGRWWRQQWLDWNNC